MQEKRKTINGEDIIWAMEALGFENYAHLMKVYLNRYKEVKATSHVFRLQRLIKSAVLGRPISPVRWT
jgi:hypothetical protein